MIHNMTVTSKDTQQKIVVDGEDISRLVARAFIDIDPDGLPEVHLVCTPMNLAIEADDVKIVEHVMTKPSEWIPVEERLPEEKENPLTHDYSEVICYCQFGGVPKADDVRVFKFGSGHFYHGPQIMDGIVTHWQYLPEPPKEGEDA